MQINRRYFLGAFYPAVTGLFLPETSHADSPYTESEYQFLENLVQQQYSRIVTLGTAGKIPLREMIEAVVPHEKQIVEKSWELGIPEYLSLGMVVVENGGGIDKSTRCCRGIMQLSKGVARTYGAMRSEIRRMPLRKGSKQQKTRKVSIDYRQEPELNINAGLRYLQHLYNDFFQDWDLAAQAYHAGPKRVMQGISSSINHGKGRRERKLSWKDVTPSVVKAHQINWPRLMQNPSAYRFFRSLSDETEYYLPKALACHRIYEKRTGLL